ncbi:MAG: zinc ribbon domain-containing protein [Clostridia bacterium]|nr:zinc ribbon domain-containing protein [Clostridia bacterium]
MAIINCPECGKEISDKCKICVHCGYPFEENENSEGKLIIKSQTHLADFTYRQLTFDIVTIDNKKICTIQPGRVLSFPVDKEMTIFATSTYRRKKRKGRTNLIKILPNKTTRVQLSFVRVFFGFAVTPVLNEIDIINSIP